MRGHRVRVCAAVLTTLLAGCTRWEPVPTPTPAASGSSLPPSLRVWPAGAASTVLVAPFVRNDTLYGRSHGDTVAVALRQIECVAKPRLDGARTAGSVAGGLALWAAVGLLTLQD